MVFLLTKGSLLGQVLEAGQVELTAQVQAVRGRVPRVLTELVERLHGAF